MAVAQLANRIPVQFGRLDMMVNAIGGYADGIKLMGDRVQNHRPDAGA